MCLIASKMIPSFAVFLVLSCTVIAFSILNNFVIMTIMWKCQLFRRSMTVKLTCLCISDIILVGIAVPQELHDVSHAGIYNEG